MERSHKFWSCLDFERETAFATLLLAAALASTGCGGGRSGAHDPGTGVVGDLGVKADGSPFFVDPNQAGRSRGPRLVEAFWGRLVDVHELAPDGTVDPTPVHRDLVVNENVQTDDVDYRLETNPITQRTRLVILRRRDSAGTGSSFEALVRRATDGFPPVLAKQVDSPPPFSQVVRNATLVLRFDDCLDDSPAARLALLGDTPTVAVLTGAEGARRPFQARLRFDPNHGAVAQGAFHSTRVLVDMTTSATEARDLPTPRPVNAVGLPSGDPLGREADLLVRIPTRVDGASGQFELLRGLSGAALDGRDASLDAGTPTRDLVRAMRIGHEADPNDGFLLDLDPPRVLGSWNVTVDRVRDVPGGRSGFDFVADLTFRTVCRAAPRTGDVLRVGDRFLEITANASSPAVDGSVVGVALRNLLDAPISAPSAQGIGSLASTYQPGTAVPAGCWVTFEPPPLRPPAAGIDPSATLVVHFSEPMSRASASPYDTLRFVRGDSGTTIHARNLVPADIQSTLDLRSFRLSPRLPLRHGAGSEDAYHARVEQVTDLAGNALRDALPPVDFLLDAAADPSASEAVVMRFGSLDELEPFGRPDVRGQFFIDVFRQVLRPRPVTLTSHPADRSNPVPSLMTPFTRPVQNPLNPLGCRLQTVWRYCDLGWQVEDETRYDLDVIGLSWAPFGGRVQDDYFERFEIALAHSRFLPDEDLNQGSLPKYPPSGLRGLRTRFADSLLSHPLAPQRVVHPADLGYRIRSAELFTASSGTRMVPFPLNRDRSVPVQTILWRDTSVPAKAGPNGAGIPLDIEQGTPLQLVERAGSLARAGEVPTIGLPLLMEFRCFPSSTALGQNGFDCSLAINSSAFPAFRTYSGGGVNASGVTVVKDPSLEDSPTGGFNPMMGGAPTPRAHDNTFYVGQLDVVTRLSRLHTNWIDTRLGTPDFVAPQVLPVPSEQPPGTSLRLDFRGAHGFTLADVLPLEDESLFPFDADRLDAYGEIHVDDDAGDRQLLGSTGFPGSIDFAGDGPDWTDSLDDLDGARFVQVRVTFVGELESGATAELSALGLSWK